MSRYVYFLLFSTNDRLKVIKVIQVKFLEVYESRCETSSVGNVPGRPTTNGGHARLIADNSILGLGQSSDWVGHVVA